MAKDDKVTDEQVKDEKATAETTEGTAPGGDEQEPYGLNGTPPFPDRAPEHAPPAGEGSDLRVDSPIVPKGKNDPRPTGA